MAFSIDLDRPLDEVEPVLRARLADEGFGVLTEIDVQATLRAKLGVEVPRKRILGACNPRLAHAALSAEPDIAVLLPCNVVLSQLPEDRTRVQFLDAGAAMEVVGNPDLGPIGREASERMHRVAGRLREEIR
ncbi:MAG: DUF302 domain-containing protein [Chloroflexota bacterium]|nr:MAG: DUF302 domain-containing protein [Chloroflexota bacterium]